MDAKLSLEGLQVVKNFKSSHHLPGLKRTKKPRTINQIKEGEFEITQFIFKNISSREPNRETGELGASPTTGNIEVNEQFRQNEQGPDHRAIGRTIKG